MSARDTALKTLMACRRQQAWSDGALKQNLLADGLDRRDAALAARLCYGVLQNRMLLDYWIEAYTNRKPDKRQSLFSIEIEIFCRGINIVVTIFIALTEFGTGQIDTQHFFLTPNPRDAMIREFLGAGYQRLD